MPFGCERTEDHATQPSPDAKNVRYGEHLRLGIEQLRRQRYATADAEFKKCSSMNPDDPELLFHLARLRLGWDADVAGAVQLLEKAVSLDDQLIKAHRMLYVLLTVQGDRDGAERSRAVVEDRYGALGALEMEATDYHMGMRRQAPKYWKVRDAAGEGDAQSRFARAANQLRRVGGYSPAEAFVVMEQLFAEHSDLPALRWFYAQKLLYETRIQLVERPDLPPISSRLILDYAQGHFERVVDQSTPQLQLASKGTYGLAEVAMCMADYDDAVDHLENLASGRTAFDPDPAFVRRCLARRGVARYKQHRYPEAISFLEEALGGDATSDGNNYPNRWNLHLAYEAAGVSADSRAMPFRLRRDLMSPPAESSLRFEDVAAKIGVNKFDGLGPSAWGDYDGDGDFDLFVCGCDSYGALYRNDGGRFRDVSAEAGLLHVQSGFSATFQDFDNDGDCDLYIGRDGWNGLFPNSLLRNNGDGTFSDITEAAGVGHPGSSFVHSWLDFDRDGNLDLYVANGITGGGDTNVLYRNNGDGTFTDATTAAGLAEPPGTRTIGFAIGDYDKDGWSDIFIGGWQRPHRLYRNRGDGTFEEVAAKAGLGNWRSEPFRYVSLFFDYDNDTYPDILMTRLAPWSDVLMGLSEDYFTISEAQRERLFRQAPKLYRNNRDGTFTDVSRKAGLLHPIGIMGTNVADLDNDGYQDIYFATGDPDVARLEPDRFYHNNGDGTFTDRTFTTGLGNLGKGHGVTFIDIEGDGDLDIYVPEGGFVHGDAWENAFYLNQQSSGNHWLHVDLTGVRSNRDGVGTSLTITTSVGQQLRQVKGGRGFGSSDSPTIEFGLGKAEVVERIDIRWPSGVHQVLRNVRANQRIAVRETE